MGNQTLNSQQRNQKNQKKASVYVQKDACNKHLSNFNVKQNKHFLVAQDGLELLKINLTIVQLNQLYQGQQFFNLRKTKKLQNIPNLLVFNQSIQNKKCKQRQYKQVQCIFSHPTRSLKQQINQRLELNQGFQQKQILTILHSSLCAFQEIASLFSQTQKQKSFQYLQSFNITDQFIFISKSGGIIFSDILSIYRKTKNKFCKKKCSFYEQRPLVQVNIISKLATVANNCLNKLKTKQYQTKSSLNIKNTQFQKKGFISIKLEELIVEMMLHKVISFQQAKQKLEQLHKITVKQSSEQPTLALKQNNLFWSQRKNRNRTGEKDKVKNEKNNDNLTKIRLSLKKVSFKQKQSNINNSNKLHLNLQNKQLAINNKQNQACLLEKQNKFNPIFIHQQRQNSTKKIEIHKLKSRKQSMEKLNILDVQNYNCDKKKLDISEHFNPITSKNMLKNHFLKKDSFSQKKSPLGQIATNKKSKQSETKQSSEDKFNSVHINPLSLQLIQNLSSILSNHGSMTLSLSNALNQQLKTEHSQSHEDQIQKKQHNLYFRDTNQYNPGQLLKKCEHFIQQSNIKNHYENYLKKNDQQLFKQTNKDTIPQFLQKFKLPQKNLLTLKNMLLTQKDVIMQESFQQSQLNSYRQNFEDDKKKSSIKNTQNCGINKTSRRVQIQKIQIKLLQQSCELEDLSKDSIQKQIIGLQNSLQECRQM